VWPPSRAFKERIAKRRAVKRAGIDSWPILGVATMVLIIFMLVSGHSPHHMVIADLTWAQTAVAEPRAIREDAIRVTISRDGSVYFRNQKTGPEALPELVRKAVEDGAELKVYLTIDGRAKYGDAKVVYDAIAAGGVRDICLMAEKIDPHR